MGKVTLYVKDEDEDIWRKARELAGGEESFSTVVAQALRDSVAARQDEESEDEEVGVMDAIQLKNIPADKLTPLIKRFRAELKKNGWELTGTAYTRACVLYGAERSRAAGRAGAARKKAKGKP